MDPHMFDDVGKAIAILVVLAMIVAGAAAIKLEHLISHVSVSLK